MIKLTMPDGSIREAEAGISAQVVIIQVHRGEGGKGD